MDFYSRIDISYDIAIRSIRHLREALFPRAGVEAILGFIMIL